MSLVVGQNSWSTVSEADTYFTNRINTTDWFSLNTSPANPGEVAKESLLISAYNWLIGASELSLSASLTDTNVKTAQMEAALFLQEHYSEMNERNAAAHTGVTGFKLSQRSENIDIKNIGIPDFIMGLLRNYVIQNTTALLLGEYDG